MLCAHGRVCADGGADAGGLRAWRARRRQLQSRHATLFEIAAEEHINESYVSQLLRLTLLAPDIIEAVLEGKQPPNMSLAMLIREIPLSWDKQRAAICR